MLHPQHTSGDEPGTVAGPITARQRAATTDSGRVSWQIAPGVTYTRWSQTDARGPIEAHLLTVDTRTPGVRIDYASKATVRRVAPVIDLIAPDHAVAGVNGDFYDIGHTGAPLGLGKDRQRGLLHGRQDGWNNAFYIDKHGKPGITDLPVHARIRHHSEIDVTNLNSPFVAPGGIGIYTKGWGKTAGYGVTQGQRKQVRYLSLLDGVVVGKGTKLKSDEPIPGTLLIGRGVGADQLKQFQKGDPLRVAFSLQDHPQMAISGNHFLVNDGIIRAVDDRDLHPRTAVGVDDDTGEVLILVVDGRSSRSRGYTMVELANLMIDLGADEAINLDGGGSSTMVGKGRGGKTKVLNTPSDGFERRVSNALEVTYTKP